MNNWVKMTNDEMEVGIEIATLKKGELQIKYAKDIVAKNKEIERLNNIINSIDTRLIEMGVDEEMLNVCEMYDVNGIELRKMIKELKGVEKE